MAPEGGPKGAVKNAPIPMVEDALEGVPATDDVSEDAVEGASEKQDKGTVLPRARQPSNEMSYQAVEPKTKIAVANASDAMPEPPASLSKLRMSVDTWRRLEEGKKLTNMYNIEDPRNTVDDHLAGWTSIKTGFGSQSLVSPSGRESYCYGYFVYGPIGGPAYHCVELVDTSKQNFDVIRGLFFPKSATTSKITEEHVVAAKILDLFLTA
ncbi:hypothetical protein DL771_004470 [Monosporascus sp. 5C6A]|nr:hypothetical protein DL771_004470 [Monosporascus sp. 5C6A]